nr:CMF_HP1_G0048570.mRNA.1.CDS.1 [Saccharomyces cerevisiae]
MGIISELFENANGKLDEVPILGICLGFQAMCLAQGADVSELNTIKHGQVYEMHLNDAARACGLFFWLSRYVQIYEVPFIACQCLRH